MPNTIRSPGKVVDPILCQRYYGLGSLHAVVLQPERPDALYGSESMRRFAGLSLTGPIPDETTILNFRHLLEKHQLGQTVLKEVNHHLERNGLFLREDTIVDATIISEPT